MVVVVERQFRRVEYTGVEQVIGALLGVTLPKGGVPPVNRSKRRHAVVYLHVPTISDIENSVVITNRRRANHLARKHVRKTTTNYVCVSA